MKFSEEKKHSILMYLIEQIDKGEQNISKEVAEKCNISRNTINQYLTELQEKAIITKLQRNKYELISTESVYFFERSKNQLNSDTYIYEKCIKKLIDGCTNEAKQIWEYALSEMVNNVIDHSMAEILTVMVKQNYLKTEIFLIDNGIGIFEKIKEHFALETLEDAKCELFKGKLTTDEDNHSGEGIFFTSKMVDEFFIISSELVFSTDKYDNDISFNLDTPLSVGTCVYMALSNFTQRQILQVFDMYSNVDGGFTKTILPLKSFFDNAPVSRSQAKRVCNRLEKFKEVTLDFAGLEWMGQAFAHQLFVVYQNAHPEVVFKPINMSKEVEKMYNHVTKTKL